MSGTVNNLFINKGIIQGKKVNVLPKKTVPKKNDLPAQAGEESKAEAPVDEAPAEAAPEAPAEEVKTE